MKKITITFIVLFLTPLCWSQIQTKPIAKKPDNNKILNAIATTKNLYDFNNIRACIDVAPPSSPLPPRAASNAYTIYNIDANGNISTVAYKRQPLAAITDKMWQPGETVTFGFDIRGGSLNLIEKVKLYAKEWERYANIKLEYVMDIRNAVIKIGFVAGAGSYSQIGREALVTQANTLTMNFGWLATLTDESLIRRVVLHEFGHALGFIHEHLSPAAAIPWDKEKVYAFYALPPDNWDRATVDNNIFTKYALTSTNYSTYDRLSIMHYPIPAELTTDGSSSPFNTDFSETDKQYAALFYSFPPVPPTATGILRTGDDCDEILFSVEYGVVASDKVEFRMEFGQAGNKTVSWWKQIGIPQTNNTETPLSILNNSLIASENKTTAAIQIPISEINKNKGISFWKAKFLGVHTQLNYKWNILPAISGGCRIKLTWRKDSCL